MEEIFKFFLKRSEKLKSVGVIAEFNPLHNGHALLLKEAKNQGTVIAVISGNFVQRGDVAIFEKRIRARAALMSGADLVLEMPVTYSMSTAQNFALGGVSVLNALGCDSLFFGSESGNAEELITLSHALNTDEFKDHLSKYLSTGMTFAASREKAIFDLGLNGVILSKPNNNLAIEYITAARNIGADFDFLTLKRVGAEHDSDEIGDNFVSASLLRRKIIAGDFVFAKKYIPENIFPLFSEENIADIKKIETAILAVLRTKSKADFKNLPDISEGIENKIFSAIGVATDLEKLYNTVKVKRYTLARIRRIVLSLFLGLDDSFFMKPPPYIRVLGFNKNGMAYLKEKAPLSPIPIITRVSEINGLSKEAKKLFSAECRATDLYSLAIKNPNVCGTEYTAKLIKTEC